jgi:Transposase DNA-binding/Transposase DDE domain
MDSEDCQEWAAACFRGVELGDARRTARAVRMASGAARRPGPRVLDVYRTSAARQGAYDFLENPAIESSQMLDSVGRATARASREHSHVFVSVDGSSLSLVDRTGSKGFGNVGATSHRGVGLKVVTAYALEPDGTPLGVLDQQWWARHSGKSRTDCRHRPQSERESRFFNNAIVSSAQRLHQHAEGTRAWFLLDRESDRRAAFDVLEHLDGHWFTIRANYDRRVLDAKDLSKGMCHRTLAGRNARSRYVSQGLRARPVNGYLRVEVPAKPHRKARTACLSVRVATPLVWMRERPGLPGLGPRAVKMTIVEAREVRTTPRGEAALHWQLWTNRPVSTFDDAKEVVQSYVYRWRIEDLHKTWKSGACNVEACQLRSADAVVKWATIMVAVAARIERLKHRSRKEPDIAASAELSDVEIRALILFKRLYKKKNETIEDTMPTLAQAVLWLAEIGGYTGRKSSGGPPGSINIRRGLEHIRPGATILEALEAEGKLR